MDWIMKHMRNKDAAGKVSKGDTAATRAAEAAKKGVQDAAATSAIAASRRSRCFALAASRRCLFRWRQCSARERTEVRQAFSLEEEPGAVAASSRNAGGAANAASAATVWLVRRRAPLLSRVQRVPVQSAILLAPPP